MKNTQIVSAFPATGKSYFTKNTSKNVLDSDSSNFSWIINEDGTKIRNPNFPNNYIQHIKENIGKVDIIFVSSHKEVREALFENCLFFTLFRPNYFIKEEYIERFKQRGNDEKFINFIDVNWNGFIDELVLQKGCDIICLERGQYISNIIPLHE